MIVVIPHHSGPIDEARRACAPHPVLVVDDRPPGRNELAGDVICTQGEQGFAHAANVGLAEAERRGHAHALLLNDDAVPAPGCIDALLAAFVDGVALAGPVLEGPGGVESAGIRFRPRTGRLTQQTRVPGAITDVDALSGACLLMASSQRFDTRFPHAMEDVELAQRVDGRVLLVPHARCHHVGGASRDRRSREATRDALTGHMRLVEPPQRVLVTGYAVLQVLREGNRRERLLGVIDAWMPDDLED